MDFFRLFEIQTEGTVETTLPLGQVEMLTDIIPILERKETGDLHLRVYVNFDLLVNGKQYIDFTTITTYLIANYDHKNEREFSIIKYLITKAYAHLEGVLYEKFIRDKQHLRLPQEHSDMFKTAIEEAEKSIKQIFSLK